MPVATGSSAGPTQVKVLLLSAYHAVSHKYWCDGLVETFPEYDWQCLCLPPRFFNWRVRGAPLSWLAAESAVLTQKYDLLIVTSMVDLATLKGLVPSLASTPSLCYFHENQFEYPKTRQQHASIDAQMVNLYAAIAADRILFNSAFNRDSFISGVNRLLEKLPDHRPAAIEPLLIHKTAVLPVPLSDSIISKLSRARSDHGLGQRWGIDTQSLSIRIIWASRWEYDKGPDRLLAILEVLEERGIDYRIAIVGEQFRHAPEEFESIKQRFGHRIVQFGFVPSKEEYYRWLASAQIVLATSIHEFQGLAVLEAVAACCVPVLPRRLAYPELVPDEYLYASHEKDLRREAQAAVDLIESSAKKRTTAPCVKHFFWSELRSGYAAVIEQMLTRD